MVTGAGGVLCGNMARAFAQAGAKVAALDLNEDAVKKLAEECRAEGFVCEGYKANVLEHDALAAVHEQVLAELGPCDILINGAGGNNPKATTDNEYQHEAQNGQKTFFDRAHSAIQEAQGSDFDWDKIFEGVDWFHFTGITPALGPNVVEICKDACKAAKAHGVKISCDLNYRGKLWTREQARAAMTELCQYVDVCISTGEDAKDVFGIEAEATDITAGELNREGYKSVARQLAEKFGFEKMAITLRESHSAFDNGWSAMLYDAASGEFCFSKK